MSRATDDGKLTVFLNDRMVTGLQIRGGRALLGWTAKDLASRAHVGLSTVLRIERGNDVPTGNAHSIQRVEEALRDGGIAFVRDDNGRVGILIESQSGAATTTEDAA